MISPGMIERAKDSDIVAVAECLGVRLKKASATERVSDNGCPACFPHCLTGHDRFRVSTSKNLYLCRYCGAGDVIQLAQRALALDFRDAVVWLAGEEKRSSASVSRRDAEQQERRQCEIARWLWGRRLPPPDTIAETYLREARHLRGVIPPTLGFLPGNKGRPPALIAAFGMLDEIEPGVLAEPANIQAVQLTYVRSDGSTRLTESETKDGVTRRAIGPHRGLPIVCSPFTDSLAVSLHEGLEDALSAFEATGLGAWASGSAPFLPFLADSVPPFVEVATIGRHQDEAGQRNADKLAQRLRERFGVAGVRAGEGIEILFTGEPGNGETT